MSEPRRVHVFISGGVQGVGYRFCTRDRATRLGISGWVRNLDDGRVEAVFQGDPERISEMVQWCRNGPRGSHVTDVTVTDEPITRDLPSFDIRR